MIFRIKHIASLLFLITGITQSFAQTYYIADDAFRQCIIDKDPSLVNTSDELIIDNAAAITGTLSCTGYGINQVDGLQYFTGISDLVLEKNNISTISEISGLTQLVNIDLKQNEISYLPSFRGFTNLMSLVLHDNIISELPELPQPGNLKHINFSQNNFSVFPDLSAQTSLEHINSSRNTNIRSIAAFPALIHLKELQIYLCGLSEVPDISQLDSLQFLNVGYNFLTALPDFSANKLLNTIYANDNNLSSFADMSVLPELTKARLYNNYLSFEDFTPLLATPAYSDIYKIVPQKEFPNPLADSYFEYDSISFETAIDKGLTDNTYSWYYNTTPLWTGTQDTFNIAEAQISQSGDFYFTITNPGFPDLTLTSVSQSVSIENCLDESEIKFSITGSTCEEPGNIIVIKGAQPRNDISFILESQSSGLQSVSEVGQFYQLNNPLYTLYAQAGEKCIKLIDENIELPIEKCKEAYFSPNNDGIDDSYYFTQQGLAKIYNKWGQLVAELPVPGEWNGMLNNNQIIQTGYYTVDINDGEEKFHLSVVY